MPATLLPAATGDRSASWPPLCYVAAAAIAAGEITDMRALGVWEPLAVKTQTLKTSIEAATMLLRIDDIVSGISKSRAAGGGGPSGPQVDDGDAVDPEQMLPE